MDKKNPPQAETKLQKNQKTTTAQKTVKTKSGRAIALFALLISVAGLITISVLGWQQFQLTKTAFTAQVQQLETELSRSQRALQRIATQANSDQSQVASLQKELKHTQAAVQAQRRDRGEDQETWVMAESEYLLRLAFYNLSFEKDADTTIALLQAANKRLGSLADPRLLPVRQVISEDIAALKATPKVNIETILIRIASLQKQVNALPLAVITPHELPKRKMTKEEIQAERAKYSKWVQHLWSSWDALKKLVIIRRNTQPLMPLLTPTEHAIIQQNLYVILGQAQWAALYGKEDIYRANLQQAVELIKRYYKIDNSVTNAMLEEVAELQKMAIVIDYPDISNSLTTLKKFARAQHAVSTSQVDSQPKTEQSAESNPAPKQIKQPQAVNNSNNIDTNGVAAE